MTPQEIFELQMRMAYKAMCTGEITSSEYADITFSNQFQMELNHQWEG